MASDVHRSINLHLPQYLVTLEGLRSGPGTSCNEMEELKQMASHEMHEGRFMAGERNEMS